MCLLRQRDITTLKRINELTEYFFKEGFKQYSRKCIEDRINIILVNYHYSILNFSSI